MDDARAALQQAPAAEAAAEDAAEDAAAGAELPPDALRRVFGCLDWRSLCAASATCAAWRSLAREDALWQRQMDLEFCQPLLLAHATQLPCEPGAPACGDGGSLDRPTKQRFAACAMHPAGAGQSLLARFASAVSAVRGWRLVFRLNDEGLAAAAAAAAAAVLPPPTSASSHSREDGSDGSGSGSGSNPDQRPALTGFPAAMTLDALRGGWCCGAVRHQVQEQSVWVRFHLPAALAQDRHVAAATVHRQLDVALEGLGPTGWFEAAVCPRFLLSHDDAEVLLQSHRTGFYAWRHDEADGMGVDRDGELPQQPWDLAPGSQDRAEPQQQQQQQQPQPAAAADAAAATTALQQPPVQAHAPKLRALVYVHYEQMLQVLPWALPQALPLRLPRGSAPGGLSTIDPPFGWSVLWLHVTVCKLHGGASLGSCIAPLTFQHSVPGLAAEFQADPSHVLVALHDQPGTAGSGSGGAPGPAGCTPRTALLLGRRCVHGSPPLGNEVQAIETAAQALLELFTMDEVMVDFALLEPHTGLLMGRAGVEIWSRSHTTHGFAADAGGGGGGGGGGGAVLHTREVQMLHFLVDGVNESLWDNHIALDAEPAPPGVAAPLLTLKLTQDALLGLYAGLELRAKPPGAAASSSEALA